MNFENREKRKGAVCKCRSATNLILNYFTKKLQCWSCFSSMFGQKTDDRMLCKKYQQIRNAFKITLCQAYATPKYCSFLFKEEATAADFDLVLKMIDSVEYIMWIQACSIAEYTNCTTITERIDKTIEFFSKEDPWKEQKETKEDEEVEEEDEEEKEDKEEEEKSCHSFSSPPFQTLYGENCKLNFIMKDAHKRS